jgi:small subunit ribosomal protein S4e
MARGPKKHLKRLNAPRAWMLSKMGGTWAPRPSPGPHKLRESLPLSLILRNRLKYALTRREIIIITARRLIKVDHKIRTDLNFPTGFMDIVSIDKTGDTFRILFDTKGRFVLHRVPTEEAQFKLCRVKAVKVGSKSSIGHNPFKAGREGAIPFLVTHDGRTIKYPDPVIKTNDTVKVDLKTGKVTGHAKFETGNIAIVTKGSNIGRVGVIVHTDHHPGSFDIVHLRDQRGSSFATRLSNVFVIGEGTTPWISLPRGKGVKLSIIEERDKQQSQTGKGRKREKSEKKEKPEIEHKEVTKLDTNPPARKEVLKGAGPAPTGDKKDDKKDAGKKDAGKKDAGKKDAGKEAGKEAGKKDAGKDAGKKDAGKKEDGKKKGK